MATSTAAPARPETHARQIFRTRDLRIRLGVHDQREFRHARTGFLPQVGRFVVEYRMRGLRGVMNFVGGLFKAGCRCGGDAPSPARECSPASRSRWGRRRVAVGTRARHPRVRATARVRPIHAVGHAVPRKGEVVSHGADTQNVRPGVLAHDRR